MTETQPAEVGGNADTRTYNGTPNLNKAIAAVQRELPQLGKTETGSIKGKNKETGEYYSYEYKYADLSSISAAIMPLLGKNGLAFVSFPTVVDRNLVLRYHLLHESGEQLTGEYPISGGTAQQLGSAITYARRYCLCAVTGIAPDKDDDAAAASTRREAEHAEQVQELDRERQLALDAVRGAWFNQYGEFNSTACLDMFKSWSRGGEMAGAHPAQIRKFAAYLHALPVKDAGSDPATETPPATEDGVQVIEDQPLSGAQKGMMFALFEDLGMKNDRVRQLAYLTKVLGRSVKSRGDVTAADATAVLKQLETDVAELNTAREA